MKTKLKQIFTVTFTLIFILCVLTACGDNKDGKQVNVFNRKTEVSLYNATDFSENNAVVLYKNLEGNNYCNAGVLNKNGDITKLKDVFVTILPEDDDDADVITTPSGWSKFADGHAYINYTDKTTDANTTYERFVIFDTKGRISMISPLDADYTILCGGDGIYLVCQNTKDSMLEYGTTNIGVVNYKGDWICPLSTPENYYDADTIKNLDQAECKYLGEHIFSFTLDRYEMSISQGFWVNLFNADTNKHIQYSDMDILSEFTDGKALMYRIVNISQYDYENGTEIYVVDSGDFELQQLFSEIAWNGRSGNMLTISSKPIMSEGYIFGVECYDYSQSYNPYFGPERKLLPKFFDTNGKEVIDLSKYEFYSVSRNDKTNGLYQFTNGVAVIQISGKDGMYITSINTNGELLYDPIKAYPMNYDEEAGVIAVKIEQNDDGETCDRIGFLNATTGELVIKDFDVEGTWCCGYCKINNYFINQDGETLITYEK